MDAPRTRRGLCRTALGTLGALAAAGPLSALAACAGGTQGGAPERPRLAAANVSLLFPGWSPEQIEQLDSVAARLQEANPGVTVEKIQAVGSAGGKEANMIGRGPPPELAREGGGLAP